MQYVYALGTRPLAQNGGAWEYLLPDALGSVRQIADANGNVTLAESYEPYGSVLNSSGNGTSIFAFAGEQIDTTGLIYLRARYMQPRLGIFTSRDPWSGDELRPGSMNGFGYGLGNPVNVTDPSGKFSAAALAKTYGSGTTPADIIQMLEGQYFNGYDWFFDRADRWGWAKLMLDAQEGDSVFVAGPVPIWAVNQIGYFQCRDGKIVLNSGASATVPQTPSIHAFFIWWRRYGVYGLASTSGNRYYRDGGENANVTDLPDVVFVGAGGAAGGKVSGAAMVDRFGNIYGSIAGGPGWSAYITYGEGYVSRRIGNLDLLNEQQLKDALSNLALNASGQFIIGATISINSYLMISYKIGSGADASISIGYTRPVTNNPGWAWAWQFVTPAYSRQQVIDQALQSLISDPCGECSAR